MATNVPKVMRAAQLDATTEGIENHIHIKSLPVPQLKGKDSVLISVAYSSLNPVDYKPFETLLIHFFSKPIIPGNDFAGTVVQSNSVKYETGERVYGVTKTAPHGALAEYIVNEGEQRIIKCPDAISLQDASTIGIAALTAYQSLVPFVKSGDRVLINGASGGVGTFAVQIAKILGCHVTAVCSGSNADLCRSLGAEEVLDYTAKSLVEQLKTHGRTQFDYILDCIFPDSALYFQAHHYLKQGATFATIAGSPSWEFIKTVLLIQLTPSFLGGGQRAFKFVVSSADAEAYDKLSQWFAGGKLRTVVEQVFDLDQTADAYRKIKTGRVKGKLVVKVSEKD